MCPAIFVLVFLSFSLHSFSRASRHLPSLLLSPRAQRSFCILDSSVHSGLMFSIIHTRCKYFDPCYARATVARASFLAAAFSDGSYLAHVNGACLRHVTFCIVRGHPLFIVSPISERGSRAAAHLTCRGTPASPILAAM